MQFSEGSIESVVCGQQELLERNAKIILKRVLRKGAVWPKDISEVTEMPLFDIYQAIDYLIDEGHIRPVAGTEDRPPEFICYELTPTQFEEKLAYIIQYFSEDNMREFLQN